MNKKCKYIISFVKYKDKCCFSREICYANTIQECHEAIKDFLKEHNYKSYYWRTCSINNDTIRIDVGSYTEFFDIKRSDGKEILAEYVNSDDTEDEYGNGNIYEEGETMINQENLVEKHRELCEELNKTYELKNKKYGDSFGSSVREFGYIAALTRISDKYNRMKQLILSKEDGSDTDERLEDTLLDTANYCIMTVMELNNKTEDKEYTNGVAD